MPAGRRKVRAMPGPLRCFAFRALRTREGQARLLPTLIPCHLPAVSSRNRQRFRQSAALRDMLSSAPNRTSLLFPRCADSRGASESIEPMGMAPVLGCTACQHSVASAYECTQVRGAQIRLPQARLQVLCMSEDLWKLLPGLGRCAGQHDRKFASTARGRRGGCAGVCRRTRTSTKGPVNPCHCEYV